MPFLSTWVHEPYILKTYFSGRVSGSELKVSMLEYLGAAQTQPMYFMMDFLDADGVPNEMLNMPAILQVINHANTRWLILVKQESASSYMTQLLSRDKVKTYRDRETALAFLRAMVRIDTGEILEKKAEKS
ncbi:MAG: hypothetical protein Q9P01_03960 [Anaerolineae bacterium]|nr:hypothetical protein [Anaerolineae bacterium]MDQ7034001.1 hypothetical protein [Anaerolineae bacterium]